MDRLTVLLALLLVLLAVSAWYFSQAQVYPPIDPSHFQKYIAIHVPSGHDHMVAVVFLDSNFPELNDEVFSQAHFAVLYNGRFVEIPSVVMREWDRYTAYLYTPVEGEHTIYLLLYPDQNMPRTDQWDRVFIPTYRVVTLPVCHPDRPGLRNPVVAAKYDPDTRKILVAIGESEHYVAGYPYNAKIAFYVLDPSSLEVLDSFCVGPSAAVMFYHMGRYAVDADPNGGYYLGFYYDYDSGGYVSYDDWEVYKIQNGSVVYSISQPSSLRHPRSLELTPSGSLYIGAEGSYGYGGVALCDGTSCSSATFDLTTGSPYPCNNDTRENELASIWCTDSGCVGMVPHSYCQSEYSYTYRWDLVNLSGTSVSPAYHNLTFDPSLGQKIGSSVYFYKYMHDSAGWHGYSLYAYWTGSSWWTNGKVFDGTTEHTVPAAPGTAFGSDGARVFTFEAAPTEVNIYAMWYPFVWVPVEDVSQPQDVSQVPVFLRSVSQHYRLAHYVIDVDVNEPGTYDVFLLLDGNLVASQSVDLSGSQTLEYYVPISVEPESNHTLSVTLAKQGFQVGYTELNATFLPALLQEYSQPDTLTQNEQYTFSITYLIYSGDTSTVDFNIQGTLYSVAPTCTPSEYNMLSCTAEYTYVPGSADDLNYQYLVHVTVDANTYTVSTPVYTAHVQQQAVSPPSVSISGPAPTGAAPAEEQPSASVQQAAPVQTPPTTMWLAIVVFIVIVFAILRGRR